MGAGKLGPPISFPFGAIGRWMGYAEGRNPDKNEDIGHKSTIYKGVYGPMQLGLATVEEMKLYRDGKINYGSLVRQEDISSILSASYSIPGVGGPNDVGRSAGSEESDVRTDSPSVSDSGTKQRSAPRGRPTRRRLILNDKDTSLLGE